GGSRQGGAFGEFFGRDGFSDASWVTSAAQRLTGAGGGKYRREACFTLLALCWWRLGRAAGCGRRRRRLGCVVFVAALFAYDVHIQIECDLISVRIVELGVFDGLIVVRKCVFVECLKVGG